MTARSPAKRKNAKTRTRSAATARRKVKPAGTAKRGKAAKPADLRLMREARTQGPSAMDAAAAPRQGKRAALPDFVKPCLATLVDKAPSGANWIHEIKFDGYRIQARLDRGKVRLLTRKGLDWTGRFPAVAEAIAKLPADAALIDGELVSEDEDGISRFSLLQQDLKPGRHDRMVLYAFDLMHLDGVDLKPLALAQRKAALAKLLGRSRKRGALRFSESLAESGAALLKQACKMGLEGIISKVADSPYRSGRGHDWLKAKCSDRQEFVVAGFAPATNDAHAVGALVLAVYDAGKLTYAGRTGTGFTHDVSRALYRRLSAEARKTSPFPSLPKEERGARGPIWVEPKMVVEVDFRGWTHGDRVRQASFQGVREDKAAKDVVREKAA
ncbi:MAG TPA: non-homologous end-joining DNA ligase [Pseudolabrys sp.]|nr:non-homologous end-joining DNA ligase [Pseudolabrys sp.]